MNRQEFSDRLHSLSMRGGDLAALDRDVEALLAEVTPAAAKRVRVDVVDITGRGDLRILFYDMSRPMLALVDGVMQPTGDFMPMVYDLVFDALTRP
jgi:hypothetical protein